MGFDVVGADTHEVDALGFVICVESDEFVSDMFDERAVVADEHHYQGFAARYVFEGDSRSVNVWKFERRSLRPEREHGACCFYHGVELRVESGERVRFGGSIAYCGVGRRLARGAFLRNQLVGARVFGVA